MKPSRFILSLATTAALASLSSTYAGLIFTVENAGVQQTPVGGASTETFNSVPLGVIGSYVSPTIGGVDGTYTSGQIRIADMISGAGGVGRYNVVGENITTSQTLNFNGDKTYFGFWWSAGDAANKIEFFDSASLSLGSYAIADIIPFLSPAYLGNPNGGNPLEYYAYLDFTTTGTTRIDKVVFTNVGVSGFQTDNHSVFDQPITPPGNPIVPEPTTALFGLAMMSVIATHRRRRR